ncbi:MAG TPA: hypothetical protein VFK14_01260 [Solirubrobacterales bacterium]|nr:hypothetical protein [Solirubrobacterales bacterium]
MLPFWLSIGFLSFVQAVLVAAPRPPVPALLERLRSRWWGLVLPLSIVVVISAVALSSASARFLTYLALVAVPPLAAAALAWLLRGSRPPLALLVIPLFATAWAAKGSLSGHAAALALSALACVSLGWLVTCVVPSRWLKLGIYAMAAVDAYLVVTDLLQAPNAVLNTAAPGAGLPRLQLAHFGSAVMGFGDLFVAATLGALLASYGRRLQLRGALDAAVLCLAFDFLFFAVDELPSTVPIALTLAALELTGRARSERPERKPSQPAR